MSIKSILKRHLPSFILVPIRRIHGIINKSLNNLHESLLIKRSPDRYRAIVKKTRGKELPLNVVFFSLFDAVWKYDELYRLMEKDPRFNPIILVCPVVNFGYDNMIMNMEKCYNLFKSRGYNVLYAYNKKTGEYLDVKTQLSPDIIFYTNPYRGLIDDRYFITQFKDVLTCYTTYGFTNTIAPELNNTFLHNFVWKRFVENKYMMQDALIENTNHGINCVNTGYTGFDTLLSSYYKNGFPWKINDRSLKRIIWAPHHTIVDNPTIYYSTFLTYYNYMLEMADKYKGQVQFAFKPHPLLKNKLEILWGKEKTKDYYRKWENLENGFVNDGSYENLFLTSDAIIHDSGSFIGEYLVTDKPAMYLASSKTFKEKYNTIGQKCLDNYYIGYNEADIEKFIVNIINGIDPLQEQRKTFVKTELLPENGKLASQNIIDTLAKELIP